MNGADPDDDGMHLLSSNDTNDSLGGGGGAGSRNGYIFAPFRPDNDDDNEDGADGDDDGDDDDDDGDDDDHDVDARRSLVAQQTAQQQHARRPVKSEGGSGSIGSGPMPGASSPARADSASPAPAFEMATETLASARRNWNEAYQEILDMPESVEKFEALRDLARDFEYAAQLYARLIVSEVCLPPDQKSIRPIKTAAGSVNAGGTKFVCAGSILFKFALDVELEPGLFMYGGNKRDDSLAMKSGNHEMRGLIAYMATETPGLHYPLMVTVDYKGYRLVASSILPIDSSTLRYGSNDGGRTITLSDSTLASMMATAASSIGLAPLNIEGHFGADQRYYVVDFSRTLPPEYISRRSRFFHPRSIFFSLLRPEFVRSHGTPLCSDAFSGFLNVCQESDARRLNQDVYLACKKLHGLVIPNFARDLVTKYASHGKSYGSAGVIERVLDDIRWIAQETHRRGINLRHLGEVRSRVPESAAYLRLILLTEMATRVLKSELRTAHRRVMELMTLPSDAPFRKAALQLLNTVIGKQERDGEVRSPYWTLCTDSTPCMKHQIMEKYSTGLSPAECRTDFDLRRNVSLRLLLLRLQEISCVKFSATASRDLTASPHTFTFTDSDIERMEAYAKTTHLVSWAEANICFLRAMQLPDRSSNEAQRLLSSAASFLETALNKATTNLRIMFLLANSLYHLSVISHTQALEGGTEQAATEDESESGTEDVNEQTPMSARGAGVRTALTAPSSAASLSANKKAPTKAVVVFRGVVEDSNDASVAGIDSLKFLSKASATLDRLMQLYQADQLDVFVGQVHNLWGHILAELGTQYRHLDPKSKQHTKWFRKALAEYAFAFAAPGATDLRSALIAHAVDELNSANRASAALALHNLTKVHMQLRACLESVDSQRDFELLLLLGEVEVALSKRAASPTKVRRFMESALSRFASVYRIDAALLLEYYARKRNVLFSVAQMCYSHTSSVCVFIDGLLRRDGIYMDASGGALPAATLVSPRGSNGSGGGGGGGTSGHVADRSSLGGGGDAPPPLNRSSTSSGAAYPMLASEYNLVRPIRDKEGYSDSSGTLWEAMCLATNEMVAIKIVDSAVWKKMGKMPQQIIKKRRKIQTDKIVHFLQVFEDNNSCTWFVMPLFQYSAYALLRKYPEMPTRVMLCIVKMALQALLELHTEGFTHGKLTMRNILIVDPESNRVRVKLTNKASYIINTLIYRNITGANDTFSPARFAKALQDYDLSVDPVFSAPAESEEEESEFSSSDTTGTISFGSREAGGSLADLVKMETKGHRSSVWNNATLSNSNNSNSNAAGGKSSNYNSSGGGSGSSGLGSSGDSTMLWTKIAKAEDIMAALRMLARIWDLQTKRIKELRGSAKPTARLNEELGDWDDLLPFVASIDLTNNTSNKPQFVSPQQRDKLPTLEEVLSKKVLRQLDAERELGQFLRKKKLIDSIQLQQSSSGSGNAATVLNSSGGASGSAATATPMRDSLSAIRALAATTLSPASTPDVEEPPTPPEEMQFVASSKREKCLAKIEETVRKSLKAGPSGTRLGSLSLGRKTSPRLSSVDRTRTVSHLMQQNLLAAPSASSQGPSAKKPSTARSITTLFSSSPPSGAGEEYNTDWVCAFVAFFYNKTWLLWNSSKCECATMEAGSGKWLWRSAKTGVVANLSARLYLRYLMQGICDSFHRMNLLNSKITFDLASSTRMIAEIRDHLRRLMRVFFHLGYHPDHLDGNGGSVAGADADESDHESSEPSTPRSPQSSPRPVKGVSSSSGRISAPTPDRNSGSRRLSKDRKAKEPSLLVPAAELWEYLLEFCTLLKVPMEEVALMRAPLFGADADGSM